MTTGLDMEHTPPVDEPRDPNLPQVDDDEPIVVEKNAKGEDMAPAASVIHWRKTAKEAKREAAETKAKLDQLASQVEAWAPIVQKIKDDPSIITRAAQPQPRHEPQEDVEARELAEDIGLIASDGSLDVGRARRLLNRLDMMRESLVDRRVAPVATATASQIAESRRIQAKQARMKDGSLVASEESVDQVFSMLPPELTANPQVAALMPILAAGLDKYMGRTPREAPRHVEYDDPLLPLPMGGRRQNTLSDAEKQLAQSTGVGEKWLQEKSNQLATNGRRGVALE